MRLISESYGTGDTSWLDTSHGLTNGLSATAKPAAFTKATHYPNGYLPSGLPVDITDRSNVKPWADAAGAVLGFVLFDQPFDGVSNTEVPIYPHGRVKIRRLPVAFTKPTTAPQPQFVFNTGSDA